MTALEFGYQFLCAAFIDERRNGFVELRRLGFALHTQPRRRSFSAAYGASKTVVDGDGIPALFAQIIAVEDFYTAQIAREIRRKKDI